MKNLIIGCLIFLVVLALAACGSSNETSADGATVSSSEPVSISIGTAGLSTPTYTYGNGMANVWNDLLSDKVKVTAVETAGGPKNISLMKNGEVQIGQVVGGDAAAGYTGSGDFSQAGSYEDLRVFALMFQAAGHWVATNDSGIENLTDLKGKTISPGPSGSSKEKMTRQILEALGMDYMDKKNVRATFIADAEVPTQLGNKQIDVAFITGQPPGARVTETLSGGNNKLISMTDEQIEKVLKENAGMSKGIIPANTYPGQKVEIQTIIAPVMWLIDANVDDDIVYELTKAYVENARKIGLPDPITEEELLSFIETDWGLPVHAGAAKYYEEQGMKIPNK